MAETDAFCWVNGVGMAHEWKWTREGMFCARCDASRINFGGIQLMMKENAQEGQDAKNSHSDLPDAEKPEIRPPTA